MSLYGRLAILRVKFDDSFIALRNESFGFLLFEKESGQFESRVCRPELVLVNRGPGQAAVLLMRSG